MYRRQLAHCTGKTMSAGQGQHQRMPTTRVGTVGPAQNGDYGSSNAAEGQPGAGMTSRQQRPCYSEDLDFIRETHDKLIALTLELEFKERKIADYQSLLDKRGSRVSSLSAELCHVKSAMEEQVRHRQAAEMRIMDITLREYSNYEGFQGLLKKLHACYEVSTALSEEIKELRKVNTLLPTFLDCTKKKMKDAHAHMVSIRMIWSKKNKHLSAELVSCKKELDIKLQVCQDAEASNQVLRGRVNDLELRTVALTADNAECRQNMQRLVEEHSNVLADNKSLVLQHRTEKEEKDQLIAQLRMLASKLCDLSDLDDGSALKLLEALGSAVQHLSDECSSLHDRERAAKTTIEALTGERDALMAENRALAEKQKDYNELQQAKESLEDHLTIHKDVAENITREVHHQLTSVMDTLKQVIQENTNAQGPFQATLQTVVGEAVQLRTQIGLFYDDWSRSQAVTSDMSEELARKKEEVQRLSAECARMDSVIREQMAEIEGLRSGITNFEQLAADSADDLARVQAEAESLKESLAAAQMEAEEREEAALLLLEKDTQISKLEGELQEKREELASLVQEKVAAMDEAERFREANQNLEETVFSLSKQLEQERNRRESMDDFAMQTEEVVKVTDAVQTDGCLVPEEQRGQLTQVSETCHALEDQMKRLAEEKIQSLEASVGERAQKPSEHSRQALAALKTENKHLKEEVSKLQEKVHNLTSETAETRDAEALKPEHIECPYREAKEENQFMRRAGSAAKAGVTPSHQALTPVQRGSGPVPAAPQEVPKCMPTQGGPFTSSSLHIPRKPSTSLAQAPSLIARAFAEAPGGSTFRGRLVVREPVLKQEKTLFTSASSPSSGLKVPVMPAESSQGSSSSEVSLSDLVRICEAIPIKPKPPSANTLQVTGKAGGKSCSTKSHAVAATKASKHLQQAKPPVKASPCKGKRPGSASAVPALSKKSVQLEEKRDSSSTGMLAGASSPKKHRFFSPSSSFYDF
ncbi:uncharacterized protein LOC144121435 isoform X3 [Amblyomma americanum]